jgi:hypothetical protein
LQKVARIKHRGEALTAFELTMPWRLLGFTVH